MYAEFEATLRQVLDARKRPVPDRLPAAERDRKRHRPDPAPATTDRIESNIAELIMGGVVQPVVQTVVLTMARNSRSALHDAKQL